MSILNVLDEQGNIVGQASREEIHQKGLLHAEVHVWFYTSAEEIIFQHRSKEVETYPDLLDATVGGHVEMGQTYLEAALMEIREEVGLEVTPEELKLIAVTLDDSFDPITQRKNHPRREVYAYQFKGDLSELKIEEGKSVGFEAWPIGKLLNLTEEEKERFIPSSVDEKRLNIFKKILYE